MAALVIDYGLLDGISRDASNLAKKADAYADHLSRRVQRKFDSLTGGSTGQTSSAGYYVSAKINQLNAKRDSYNRLSAGVNSLVENAKRIDQQVADAISRNKEDFLEKNEHLRIEGWKADILNWLVDLKNSCPLFDMIGNAIRDIGDSISGLLDNIKYWYKCEGGKEICDFVWAIGGVIVAVALFIASFPISGFITACAMIGAAIGVLNAVMNLVNSARSIAAAKNDDPAWAKIYGDQDKFTDWLRQTNFKDGGWNRFSYGAATLIDGVELFCDAVNIVDMMKNFKSKFSFIQNYFDKNTGLLSYCKTPKWTDATDGLGNVIEGKKVMKANKYGIVETKFTPKSIWNGIKAYVMDKPIDCHSDKGIRTVLNHNFKVDVKDWTKSVFNKQGFKDTFKYKVTDGGRISFGEWKKTLTTGTLKDTIRYNLKNNSFKGVIADGVKWEHRKDYIKSSAKSMETAIKIGQKVESFAFGEYDMAKDIEDTLKDKGKKFFDSAKIMDKIGKVWKNGEKMVNNTYVYKHANAAT